MSWMVIQKKNSRNKETMYLRTTCQDSGLRGASGRHHWPTRSFKLIPPIPTSPRRSHPHRLSGPYAAHTVQSSSSTKNYIVLMTSLISDQYERKEDMTSWEPGNERAIVGSLQIDYMYLPSGRSPWSRGQACAVPSVQVCGNALIKLQTLPLGAFHSMWCPREVHGTPLYPLINDASG